MCNLLPIKKCGEVLILLGVSLKEKEWRGKRGEKPDLVSISEFIRYLEYTEL